MDKNGLPWEKNDYVKLNICVQINGLKMQYFWTDSLDDPVSSQVTYSYPRVTYSDPKVTHSDPTHLPFPPLTSPVTLLAIALLAHP